MTPSRRLLACALLTAFAALALTPPVRAAAGHTHNPPAPMRGEVRVYLMRGLFGVFSLGMDDLAKKLQANGYQATVYGWDSWPQVVSAVVNDAQDGSQPPIVIIGHSLGANSVFSVVDALNTRSIPVKVGVTFDATEPGLVPNNVSVFINFWARDGFGHPVTAVPGYNGDLEDYDLSDEPGISHTSIDALDRFHEFIIGKLDDMTTN